MYDKKKSNAYHPVTNFINKEVMDIIDDQNQFYKRYSSKGKYSRILTFTFRSKYCTCIRDENQDYKNVLVDAPEYDVYEYQDEFIFNVHDIMLDIVGMLKAYELLRHVSVYLRQDDYAHAYHSISIRIDDDVFKLYNKDPEKFHPALK